MMNKTTRNRLIFWGSTVVLGLVCMGLRFLMMTTGVDERGLLTHWNIPHMAMWVITIGYLAALGMALRLLGGTGKYPQVFPESKPSGGLAMAGGVLMLLWVVSRWADMAVARNVVGVLASLAMVCTGFCRWSGMHPNFPLHGLVCVFFVMELTDHYRGWSADPQIQEYGFQLLAGVLLMLASFHRTCCDAWIISRRKTVFTCMAALYFCLISLSDGQEFVYYAAAGLWAGGSVCTLESQPRYQRG